MNKSQIFLISSLVLVSFLFFSCSDSDEKEAPVADETEKVEEQVKLQLVKNNGVYYPVVEPVSKSAILSVMEKGPFFRGSEEYLVREDGSVEEFLVCGDITEAIEMVDESNIEWSWFGIGPEGEHQGGSKTYPFSFNEEDNTLLIGSTLSTVIHIEDDWFSCTCDPIILSQLPSEYVLAYWVFRRITKDKLNEKKGEIEQ